MSTVGVITEYNPFHTGHAFQLRQIRKRMGPDTAVVCAMSGNWVQRGECAVADKWLRASWALAGGADLVLEIPTLWAAAPAERFAQGGVEVLAASGVVDALAFGSESGDGEGLSRLAACLDSREYAAGLRDFLDEGLPFAACRQAAAERLLGREAGRLLSQPNDNLGVEYLRALGRLRQPWPVLALPRVGPAHDSGGTVRGFRSASALRELLREGRAEQAQPWLPSGWPAGLEPASLAWAERAVLARLWSMEAEDWARLPDSGAGEGLPFRLAAAAREAGSLTDFLTRAKTRRYSHARLRRLALWAFLGLEEGDRPASVPYLRVLGAGPRGRELLRDMRHRAGLPVVVRPSGVRRLGETARRVFALEARCTDWYGLCLPRMPARGREWREGLVLEGQDSGQ